MRVVVVMLGFFLVEIRGIISVGGVGIVFLVKICFCNVGFFSG